MFRNFGRRAKAYNCEISEGVLSIVNRLHLYQVRIPLRYQAVNLPVRLAAHLLLLQAHIG